MYKIKTMNHISPYGLQKLEERGCVVGEDIQAPDGLILRSADLHSYAFDGSAGFAKMQAVMQALRAGVASFGGKKVLRLMDYAAGLDGLTSP